MTSKVDCITLCKINIYIYICIYIYIIVYFIYILYIYIYVYGVGGSNARVRTGCNSHHTAILVVKTQDAAGPEVSFAGKIIEVNKP